MLNHGVCYHACIDHKGLHIAERSNKRSVRIFSVGLQKLSRRSVKYTDQLLFVCSAALRKMYFMSVSVKGAIVILKAKQICSSVKLSSWHFTGTCLLDRKS